MADAIEPAKVRADPQFQPWLAMQWQVAKFAPYFPSVDALLTAGLPWLLEPGRMEVVHKDEGGGAFLFTLALTHPWLGELVYQAARFRDA